jgi:4-oxalomesaconate tautomerase
MGSADGVRCMLIRGGTSKGAYFLAGDLPADPAERDDLLLRIMGSPDARQIDGVGGAHPLTSKVAVISRSDRADADIDYLFLQVGVDAATVEDRQNCGNLLAGVGPFAVERGLVAKAPVRIHLVNSGSVATAVFPGADGTVDYDGQTAIAGVPGTAAAVVLNFAGTEGSAAAKPGQTRFDIEHPSGHLEVETEIDTTRSPPAVIRAAVVRTARKLFDGTVFPRRYS